ncbi:transposase [Candidatus Marsarchaeota archaeon]|nr:transposase [Candidatus Marsarchaeota archaeon]
MKQYYVGLDLGTKWIYGTIIDKNKVVVKEGKFLCTTEELESFLLGKPKESLNVVLEACGIWIRLYDYLKKRCSVIKVANTLKTKAIGFAKIKTDKIDSKILAELLLADMIPEVYIPNEDIRNMRKTVRHRGGIVRMRTMLKNQTHAILREKNLRPSIIIKDIFTNKGTEWLKNLNIPEIDSCCRIIDTLNREIKTAEIASSDNHCNKEIELLKTMP